jgi:hypothetical protein
MISISSEMYCDRVIKKPTNTQQKLNKTQNSLKTLFFPLPQRLKPKALQTLGVKHSSVSGKTNGSGWPSNDLKLGRGEIRKWEYALLALSPHLPGACCTVGGC